MTGKPKDQKTSNTAIPAKVPPGPLKNPRYEKFALLVSQGMRRSKAAVAIGKPATAGRYYGHLPEIKARKAELEAQETARVTAETEKVSEERVKLIRKVTIDRNDIIMGLVDCIQDRKTDVARLNVRVKAWLGLADIYMLRAKNLQDLSNFYSWTADELQTWATDGTVPIRFRHLFGPGGPQGGLKPASLRGEKLGEQSGGQEVGGGSDSGHVHMGDTPHEDV